jgi:AcrR family transcriptional regulator
VPAAKRRTQEERRSTTIARLLDATIAALANQGYARTTVAGVCKEAKLSQGALFRHFPSRAALIAAATEEICRRHIAIVGKSVVSARSAKGLAAAKALVTTIRDASRTPEHAAWHEVMVAARSDETLRALVSPTLQAFEADLLSALRKLGGATGQNPRFGTILLSLMHVFDSEAVTIAVYGNPPLEADRVEWLAGLLHQELMLP